MTFRRLVFRSLWFYRRTALLAAFGIAVATAAITGSLLLGDSVRASLREAALRRLGRIEHALAAPGLFRAALARDMAAAPPLAGRGAILAPALLMRGAARSAETEAVVPAVNVVGIEAGFAALYPGAPLPALQDRQAAVNASLSRDLGLMPGSALMLTVERRRAAPSDSLFARRKRAETTRTLRLEVAAVLPDAGVGGFALDAGTAPRRLLFVPRAWLASQISAEGMANALLAASPPGGSPLPSGAWRTALSSAASLPDYGLKLVPNPSRGYLSVQSAGMLLSGGQVHAVEQAATDCGAKPALTSVYLASTLRNLRSRREIAYVVLAGEGASGRGGDSELGARHSALSHDSRLPTLDSMPSPLRLNRWAADDLGARPGDPLEVEYLVPAWDGVYRTKTGRFRLDGIVGMETADPGLVPAFKGITDARRIGDWNPPFPVDLHRVTPRDEAYWDRYRAAPKAFIPIETMQALWAGAKTGEEPADWVTSVRIKPRAGQSLPALEPNFLRALAARLRPEAAGMVFLPVRQRAIAASEGATDFGQLFLALSFFLVLAAAGLAGMLMRLSMERRAAEIGLLLACGLPARTARRLLLTEGTLIAGAGALAGAPVGIIYARLILQILKARWPDIILTLHIHAVSVAVGMGCGMAVGMGAAFWSLRGASRLPVLRLLSGWQAMAVTPAGGPGRLRRVLLVALPLLAAGLVLLALVTRAIPPTVAFFTGGAALLTAGLLACDLMLARSLRADCRTGSGASDFTLPLLALRNAATHRGHSILAVGLLAAASFLLVAVAANTRDFARADLTRRDSGTGGFSLVATSSLPVSYDFGTPAGRANLGFAPEDEAAFQGVTVVPFLVSPGEDISCLNLAKPTAPRLLGVRREMITRGGFTVTTANRRLSDPWELLNAPARDGAIPAFGDSESVLWSLHSGLGQVYPVPGGDGRPVRLRLTGLVAQSLFAGELLISESSFRRVFPEVRDPRYFLIAVPPGGEDRVADALRRNLGETGLEVRSTREILNALIGVQNTYLSTFLALGGLGLLLGTIGLATVLLRNALERRRELALLVTLGFGPSEIARLLTLENAGLLITGLLLGAGCALVAVAPQLGSVETHVRWEALFGLLAGILAVGLLACATAGRAAARGPLLEALRSE